MHFHVFCPQSKGDGGKNQRTGIKNPRLKDEGLKNIWNMEESSLGREEVSTPLHTMLKWKWNLTDSYCFIQPHYAVLDLQYKKVDSLDVIALRFVDSCFQKITQPEESTRRIMSFLLISLFTNWAAFCEPLGIAIIVALNSLRPASRW